MINQKLLNDVARYLSGLPAVVVRLQPPAWDGAGGCAWKTVSGGAIIDIDPGTQDFLATFLHETAHLRYDFPTMTPTDCWKMDPGSLKISAQTKEKNRPMEAKADVQTDRWKQYAIENAWKYYSGDNFLEKELFALLACPVEEKSSTNQKEFETWTARQLKIRDDYRKRMSEYSKMGMKSTGMMSLKEYMELMGLKK